MLSYNHTHNYGSVLDLTIAHRSLAFKLNWSSGIDSWGNDYLPIFISSHIRPDLNIIFRKQPKLYSDASDWSSFQVYIDKEIIRSFLSNCDVETQYSTFTAIIEGGLKKANSSKRNNLKYSKINHKIYSPPPCLWWNSECDKLTYSSSEGCIIEVLTYRFWQWLLWI